MNNLEKKQLLTKLFVTGYYPYSKIIQGDLEKDYGIKLIEICRKPFNGGLKFRYDDQNKWIGPRKPLSWGSNTGWNVTEDCKIALCRVEYDDYINFEIVFPNDTSPMMYQNKQSQIATALIKIGEEKISKPIEHETFTNDHQVDLVLNNIKDFPHVIVLAALMDRQIGAERAWKIPSKVVEEIGSYHFNSFASLTLDQLKKIFKKHKLHRFNDTMAEVFFNGIRLIESKYSKDASKIWSGNPSSATVVKRILEFPGAGIKIATMLTNILVRDFKVPLSDYSSIEISPDVQVMKVFKRAGFLSSNPTIPELIYCAREIYPKYPGIIDLIVWKIGRQWCSTKPDCQNCIIRDLCPKLI